MFRSIVWYDDGPHGHQISHKAPAVRVWFSHEKPEKFRSWLDLSGKQTTVVDLYCESTGFFFILEGLCRKVVDSWRTDRAIGGFKGGIPRAQREQIYTEKREHEFILSVYTHYYDDKKKKKTINNVFFSQCSHTRRWLFSKRPTTIAVALLDPPRYTYYGTCTHEHV